MSHLFEILGLTADAARDLTAFAGLYLIIRRIGGGDGPFKRRK